MALELQPVLRGQLLELRPMRAEDFEELYAAASDPLVWEQHPAWDRYREDVFREYFRGGMASGGAFVAVDLADGKIIGSSRYYGYNEARRQVEIGWTFLARSHWGGRYNGEMKELMLRHAFQFVDRVVFSIGERNLRSQRAVEKIGGVRVGEKADGRGGVSLIYEIRAGKRFRKKIRPRTSLEGDSRGRS